MANQVSFSFYRGEDFVLPIKLEPARSVVGQSFALRAWNSKATEEIEKLSADGGVTVIDSSKGTFQVPFAAADLEDITPDVWYFTFRRVDAGHNECYDSGSFYVLPGP